MSETTMLSLCREVSRQSDEIVQLAETARQIQRRISADNWRQAARFWQSTADGLRECAKLAFNPTEERRFAEDATIAQGRADDARHFVQRLDALPKP